MSGDLLTLTPLESAIDTPIGEVADAPPFPEVDPALDPLTALERALLPALQSEPCLVTFSGGRDSSAVLAVATQLARREGLPLPVPATNRFPDRPENDESRWQELVVRHLELPDWHQRTFHDELDLIGPVAQKVLRRHGLLTPSNAYSMLPLLEDAGAGALVTGLEGDGLFSGWGSVRALGVLSGQARPLPRDLLSIGKAFAPKTLRRIWFRHRAPRALDATWLRPSARAELEEDWAAQYADEPRRWDRRVAWWARRRYVVVTIQSLDVIAKATAAKIVHPLLDPFFLAALARHGGRRGFGDRTNLMRRLFGGHLPETLLSRADKPDFTLCYFNEWSRRFVANWDGSGVPNDTVDAAALRKDWESDLPDARGHLLLQAAWAAASPSGKLEQAGNCRLE